MPFQMYISNYRCHLSFTYGNLDAQKHIFSHRIFIIAIITLSLHMAYIAHQNSTTELKQGK